MTSGIDPDANLQTIENAVATASAHGAVVLFTPEMALLLDRDRARARQWIESAAPQETIDVLSQLARRASIDLTIGSLPMTRPNGKWVNRSLYFSAKQGLIASYDKMHMFDVALPSGETWQESAAYEPGDAVVTVDPTPIGRLGLTICYDVRFPALFSALGNRLCDTIAVPAAFTKTTGKAHWHVLLRARAIEASAFVVAAAQVGSHEDGRETYGHSVVIDPWGDILLDMGGKDTGVAIVDIDLGRIAEVRSQLPSLANRRAMPN